MRIPPLVRSALLWIGFIVYWSVAAARDLTRGGAAPTVSAESPGSRKIRLEEARLHEVFGERYAAYAKQSRAIVPGIL